MKSIVFSLLFLLLPKLAISQVSENDKMILLDSTFNETKNQNHPYYRLIRDYKSEKSSYVFNDYSISGVLMSEGTSSNKDYIVKEGKFTYYYTTGAKRRESYFVKNRLHGKETQWYMDGKKKEEGEHMLDEKEKKSEYKVDQFWTKDGVQTVTNGNGDYEKKEKKFFGKGKVKNGFKDGVWTGWFIKPENKYIETYKEGQFISGKTVDENNIETVYDILEAKPKPKDGIEAFYRYIGKNFKLSEHSKGINGKIYVTFVVDKDGKIVDPKILRDLGYGTGEEAIRVLMNCENWIPGEQRGQKVRSTYSLPITIQSAN